MLTLLKSTAMLQQLGLVPDCEESQVELSNHVL